MKTLLYWTLIFGITSTSSSRLDDEERIPCKTCGFCAICNKTPCQHSTNHRTTQEVEEHMVSSSNGDVTNVAQGEEQIPCKICGFCSKCICKPCRCHWKTSAPSSANSACAAMLNKENSKRLTHGMTLGDVIANLGQAMSASSSSNDHLHAQVDFLNTIIEEFPDEINEEFLEMVERFKEELKQDKTMHPAFMRLQELLAEDVQKVGEMQKNDPVANTQENEARKLFNNASKAIQSATEELFKAQERVLHPSHQTGKALRSAHFETKLDDLAGGPWTEPERRSIVENRGRGRMYVEKVTAETSEEKALAEAKKTLKEKIEEAEKILENSRFDHLPKADLQRSIFQKVIQWARGELQKLG